MKVRRVGLRAARTAAHGIGAALPLAQRLRNLLPPASGTAPQSWPQDRAHAAAVSWLRLCDDSFGVVECEVVAGCELPKPRGLTPGTRVRVIDGPLINQIGLLALLKPRERVLVLLHLLGGEQRVDLARNAVEAV